MTIQRATIRRILCPTDFSEFSGHALARALRLATWFRADVTVLHAIPFTAPTLPAFGAAPETPVGFLTERHADVKARMRDVKATFATKGVPLDTVIIEGDPVTAIESCARELPADLVVMGTHGKSGFNRLLLGSTTERAIRGVACPVLTVGPRDGAASGLLFRRILCAVDLSKASERTLETALSFAEENLATVTLLNVAAKPREEWAPAPVIGANNEQFEQALRAAGSRELTRLVEAHPSHAPVLPRMELGTAWREIIRVAEEETSDLIVIGAHADRTLGPRFVGSTAGQVARHAPCPVLVVRHDGERV